jgi:hypothetical protein
MKHESQESCVLCKLRLIKAVFYDEPYFRKCVSYESRIWEGRVYASFVSYEGCSYEGCVL